MTVLRKVEKTLYRKSGSDTYATCVVKSYTEVYGSSGRK